MNKWAVEKYGKAFIDNLHKSHEYKMQQHLHKIFSKIKGYNTEWKAATEGLPAPHDLRTYANSDMGMIYKYVEKSVNKVYDIFNKIGDKNLDSLKKLPGKEKINTFLASDTFKRVDTGWEKIIDYVKNFDTKTATPKDVRKLLRIYNDMFNLLNMKTFVMGIDRTKKYIEHTKNYGKALEESLIMRGGKELLGENNKENRKIVYNRMQKLKQELINRGYEYSKARELVFTMSLNDLLNYEPEQLLDKAIKSLGEVSVEKMEAENDIQDQIANATGRSNLIQAHELAMEYEKNQEERNKRLEEEGYIPNRTHVSFKEKSLNKWAESLFGKNWRDYYDNKNDSRMMSTIVNVIKSSMTEDEFHKKFVHKLIGDVSPISTLVNFLKDYNTYGKDKALNYYYNGKPNDILFNEIDQSIIGNDMSDFDDLSDTLED